MKQFPFEDDFSVGLLVVPDIDVVALINMTTEGKVRHTTKINIKILDFKWKLPKWQISKSVLAASCSAGPTYLL